MPDVVEVLSNVAVVYDAVKVVFGDELWKGNELFNVDVSVDVGKVVLEIDVKSMFDVVKVSFSVEVSMFDVVKVLSIDVVIDVVALDPNVIFDVDKVVM